MKNKFLKILLVVIGFVLLGGAVFFITNKQTGLSNISAEQLGDYRLYELGTEITFNRGGNSLKYMRVKDGWGGQENEYRCTVGNETIMKLYIPDSDGVVLKLQIDAFGVFAEQETSQTVDVYANERKIITWAVSEPSSYLATIPTSAIKDNKLVLKFVPHAPYCPKGDSRDLSMAVKKMKITKPVAGKTRVKLSLWLRELFFGKDF